VISPAPLAPASTGTLSSAAADTSTATSGNSPVAASPTSEADDINGFLKSEAAALQPIASTRGFAGASRFASSALAAAQAGEQLAEQNLARLDADRLAAQQSIVARFGTLHMAPLSLKVEQFAAEGGYLPSHLFDVVHGMGLTLARVHEYGEGHEPNINQPDLLFYVPANPSKPALGGSFTDLIADGEYVLVGWGYYADYAPGATPQLEGLSAGTTVPENEWFIHEAGYHTIDGGFAAVAPENESWRGESAGAPPTPASARPHTLPIGAHGRVWDLHVFRSDLYTGENTPPTIGMLAPHEMDAFFPAQTLDLTSGFFYPENPQNPAQAQHSLYAPARDTRGVVAASRR
jgi:hypothetical protein